MPESIYVNDLRPEGDSTLSLIPRCTTFDDVHERFFTTIDRQYGWDIAPAGEQVFKLVGFTIRTGPSFFNKVLNPDGTPRPGVLINAWYPGTSEDPNWTPKPPYEAKAFGDFTNQQGVWGLPIGGLILDVRGKRGPLTLWPFIGANDMPPRYSDAVRNIGWYPTTDHLAAHPEWQVVTKGGTTPTPPPPATGDNYIFIYHNGQVIQHIPVYEGEPPANFSGLVWMADDGELWYTPSRPGAPA